MIIIVIVIMIMIMIMIVIMIIIMTMIMTMVTCAWLWLLLICTNDTWLTGSRWHVDKHINSFFASLESVIAFLQLITKELNVPVIAEWWSAELRPEFFKELVEGLPT